MGPPILDFDLVPENQGTPQASEIIEGFMVRVRQHVLAMPADPDLVGITGYSWKMRFCIVWGMVFGAVQAMQAVGKITRAQGGQYIETLRFFINAHAGNHIMKGGDF